MSPSGSRRRRGAGAPKPGANPTCFVSYSWDSMRHRAWVRRLSEALVSNGVSVRLDIWEPLGRDLPEFMEAAVRECQFVALICTPRYAERANARTGGVGYETGVITGELFSQMSSTKKFVPILRGVEAPDSLPSYLRGKKYLDARSSRRFETYLKELLHHFWGEPAEAPPRLGPRPDLANPVVPKPLSRRATKQAEVRVEQTADLDHAIREKEAALAKLMRQWRPSQLTSPNLRRLLGDRADAISRLSFELEALRERRAKQGGHASGE